MKKDTQKPKPHFAYQAAKFSWLAPIILFVVSAGINNARNDKYSFGEQLEPADRAASIAISIAALTISISGLILAFRALKHVKELGPERISKPATIGIILNSLLLISLVLGIIIPLVGSLAR